MTHPPIALEVLCDFNTGFVVPRRSRARLRSRVIIQGISARYRSDIESHSEERTPFPSGGSYLPLTRRFRAFYGTWDGMGWYSRSENFMGWDGMGSHDFGILWDGKESLEKLMGWDGMVFPIPYRPHGKLIPVP